MDQNANSALRIAKERPAHLFRPGNPKPANSGRKKGQRNRGTELVKATAKTAVEIARNGGKSPIEVVVETSRFLVNLGAFGQSKMGQDAKQIYEALWSHGREREIIVGLLVQGAELAAKALPFCYPRLAAIEWIGDAPSAVHNDNRVIITMNLGDSDPQQTVIDGETVGTDCTSTLESSGHVAPDLVSATAASGGQGMTRDWLATAIYKALKDNDEWALIQGTPESGRTVIDGDFNLQAVAEIILREADMMFPVVLDDVGRWRD